MERLALIQKSVIYISDIEERHPYWFPLLITLIITFAVLFYTSPIYMADMQFPTDVLEYVNLESVNTPARVVKKDISSTGGDSSEVTAERAVGTSDIEGPVDISFYPNIAVPKPVGKLKKIYPKSAREQNIDATVNVEILINPDGRVQRVNILGIRISKSLPSELSKKITGDFASAALQILLGAQFSPPVVNGKRVPIKMELPLNFRMDEA